MRKTRLSGAFRGRYLLALDRLVGKRGHPRIVCEDSCQDETWRCEWIGEKLRLGCGWKKLRTRRSQVVRCRAGPAPRRARFDVHSCLPLAETPSQRFLPRLTPHRLLVCVVGWTVGFSSTVVIGCGHSPKTPLGAGPKDGDFLGPMNPSTLGILLLLG